MPGVRTYNGTNLQDTTKPQVQDMKKIENIRPIQCWKSNIQWWKLRD